jgi:prevent-host-death family protein
MMPTVLNVNEAKANFSGVLAEVERNMLTITITRYGRPIARVVPIERKARSLSPIPGLAGKIKINCDLFADGSEDWEACKWRQSCSFDGRGHVQGYGTSADTP